MKFIPMSFLETGAFAVIKNMQLSKEIREKLFDIGVRLDSTFEVFFKGRDIIIKMNKVKIALDKLICEKILVSPSRCNLLKI